MTESDSSIQSKTLKDADSIGQELSALSMSPTDINRKVSFTTPQRPVKQTQNIRNTVAARRDLPDRNVDLDYILAESSKAKAKLKVNVM